MSTVKRILAYLSAFVLSVITIFSFLYFKSMPVYSEFKQSNYIKE